MRQFMATYLASANLPSRTEVLGDRRTAGRRRNAARPDDGAARTPGSAAFRRSGGARAAAPAPAAHQETAERRAGGVNPTADRIASEVERTIQRSLKGLEYFGVARAGRRPHAQGRHLRAGHAAPVPLPSAGRRDLSHPDPHRDGDEQSRLHPRPRAGAELRRVSACAKATTSTSSTGARRSRPIAGCASPTTRCASSPSACSACATTAARTTSPSSATAWAACCR